MESSRRRLWGDLWADHELPALPEVEQLRNALAVCGLPAEIIEDIRGVADAVEDALAASLCLGAVPSIMELMRDPELPGTDLTDQQLETLYRRRAEPGVVPVRCVALRRRGYRRCRAGLPAEAASPTSSDAACAPPAIEVRAFLGWGSVYPGAA